MSLTSKPNLVSENDSILVEQTKKYLDEIYLYCPEYNDPESLSKFVERVGRIKIIERVNLPNGAIVSEDLSALVIKKKCNPALTSDLKDDQFDRVHFNPLKYAFDFSRTETSYISVGKSQYIISVAPKRN